MDGILEVGDVSGDERAEIEKSLGGKEGDIGAILDRAGDMLGLTQGASLVLIPTASAPIRHIEFVSLGPDRVLVVLVTADGHVENRIFNPPQGLTPSAMREAANFLNAVLLGRTLGEVRGVVSAEIAKRRAELDALSQRLIEDGVAVWAQDAEAGRERLIVRGRANLLEASEDAADLDRIRQLFDDLERKRDLAQLLDLTEGGRACACSSAPRTSFFTFRFRSRGLSLYECGPKDHRSGGVIGPTRLNYGRIVPIVDYTAQLVGRLVSDRTRG